MWLLRGLTVLATIIAALLSSCSSTLAPTLGTHQSEPTQEIPQTVENPPITPTSTVVEPEYADIVINRLDILPSLPKTAELDGKLFLDVRVGSTSPPLRLDMKTGEKILQPELEKDGLYFRLSPDHRSLAFMSFQTGEDKLVVMTADGNEREVADWSYMDWLGIAYWINNQKLAVATRRGFERGSAPPLLFFNVENGIYHQVEGEYPYIDETAADNLRWRTSTFYDPTESLVAYVAYKDEASSLILWDLQKEEIIGELKPWRYSFDPPKWSLDGQNLFIVNEIEDTRGTSKSYSEIFSMTTSGEIQRLTNLSGYYGLSRITSFRPSPDSRFVAFWFENPFVDEYETLLILDIHQSTITNYYIPGNQWGSVSGNIVWSPSSRQLVVNNISEDSESISRVILFDIEEEYAAVIAENLAPIAWLADSP